MTRTLMIRAANVSGVVVALLVLLLLASAHLTPTQRTQTDTLLGQSNVTLLSCPLASGRDHDRPPYSSRESLPRERASGSPVMLNHSGGVSSPCAPDEVALSHEIIGAFENKSFVRLKPRFHSAKQRAQLRHALRPTSRIWRAYDCLVHVYADMYDGQDLADMWRLRAPKRLHHPFWWPLHTMHSPRDVLHVAAFIGRLLNMPLSRTLVDNLNMTDHVTTMESVGISDLAPLRTFDDETEVAPKKLVEIGCGMGGFLGLLCPMPPVGDAQEARGGRCAGADITAALIKNAKLSFPHIDFWRAFGAPHVATGSMDVALTHGVIYALEREDACDHLTELLRILKPGSGLLVSDSLARFDFGARFSPTFFSDEPFLAGYNLFTSPRVDHARYQRWLSPMKLSNQRTPTFMRGCPNLSRFVKRVDFIRGLKTSVKTMNDLYNGHSFGVRIHRSSVPMTHVAPLRVPDAPFTESRMSVGNAEREHPNAVEAVKPYKEAVQRAAKLVWRNMGTNEWFAAGEKLRRRPRPLLTRKPLRD